MDTKEGTALVEADHTEQLSKDDQYFKDYQNFLVERLRPPLHRVRVMVLEQQLRKNGTFHKEAAWCEVAKDIGFNRANTERAVNDLVDCCFAQLSVKNGELLLELLDRPPDADQCSGHQIDEGNDDGTN